MVKVGGRRRGGAGVGAWRLLEAGRCTPEAAHPPRPVIPPLPTHLHPPQERVELVQEHRPVEKEFVVGARASLSLGRAGEGGRAGWDKVEGVRAAGGNLLLHSLPRDRHAAPGG